MMGIQADRAVFLWIATSSGISLSLISVSTTCLTLAASSFCTVLTTS